ncbi:MAG: PTS sugar transporter subunit IIB [Micrococcales bacterium]|nr:PTS sugar transporter subunit IIB [Micrococcales bacterium]
MKILCVCGLGMGSSLILKMTVEKAMKELGLYCDVQHEAAGTMAGLQVDLILAANDFSGELDGAQNAVFVDNIMNVAEVKEKIEAYLNSQ